MKALKKLDQEFLQSKEGKELMEEWKEFKALEHSHWAKKYDVAWKKAPETKEAKMLHHALDSFGKSKEWHALEKELKDLDAALQKHVKVSDVPEHWKHNTDLLKIEVDETGSQAIEKEFNDIEDVMEDIQNSEPVSSL